MNVPTVSENARGIFDIFVPGMFLLLNLGLVIYLLPFVDNETKNFIETSFTNPAFFLIIAIGFGYLIGVLLRLLRTEYPDKWSSRWLQIFDRGARQNNGELVLWASEEFPYIGCLEIVCKRYLSPEALDFYTKIWAPRKTEGQNRQFFNFCKVLINSKDERAASEINTAEALSRYIAAMFFALAVSCCLLLITFILRIIFLGQGMTGLIVIIFIYISAMIIILHYFRFVRIKEVEIVFAATFKNRAVFENSETTSP